MKGEEEHSRVEEDKDVGIREWWKKRKEGEG